MAEVSEKPIRRKVENPTLDAIAPEELSQAVPAAERWILLEIQRLQRSLKEAGQYRQKALAAITERFHQRLTVYCRTKLGIYRSEAEDIAQDVYQDMEKILEKVENEQHLRNLLFRIAKNKCADAVARHSKLELSDEIRAVAPEELEEDALDPEILRNAIKQLPKLEDRILLTLSLDHRMPLKQIASVLEISEGACKMRRSRARKKLREMLQDELDEDED